MPELPTLEGRLPELRLPEISRDDIIKSFSEIRRPDLEMPAIEWPKVDLSKIEVTRDDVDKAILGVATAARLVRPAMRSSRLPLALAFVAVAAVATIAILTRPTVRDRLAIAAREAQRRIDEVRNGPALLEVEEDIALDDATPDAVAIPIEPEASSRRSASRLGRTSPPRTPPSPYTPPMGRRRRHAMGRMTGALVIAGRILRSRDLRRIFGAFLLFNMAEFGTWVAVLLYAYERTGPASVGIVALVQLIPAALAAPPAAGLGDRFPRHRVLFGGYVVQAFATGLTAAMMVIEAPVVVVYAAAAFAAASVVVARPTQSAMLPSLSQTPKELTAANGAAEVVEGIGVLLGPLLAAVILTGATPARGLRPGGGRRSDRGPARGRGPTRAPRPRHR